jgi:proteasome beta subunit
VTLPAFETGHDPGASFSELLQRSGLAPFTATGMTVRHPGNGGATSAEQPQLIHATTIVAMRFADGVVMAADRRATAGNVIAHRQMDKLFPADNWSGVSISGVAGMAMEMVKMFQLELEHYEKVEGVPLSLEGKANRLSNMVRGNLPMVMQAGMVVLPIFAGYDLRRREGRIFNYDVTGGRYEEMEYHATGSGGTYARGMIKQRWARSMPADAAIDLALESLFEAADEDSATGGPDIVRGIYPTVATITADGFQFIDEPSVAARFDQVVGALRNRQATPYGSTVGANGVQS